jgi:hypothetical protein
MMRLESPAYWKVWERGEMGTNIWSENMKGRNFLVGLGANFRIILKWILKIWEGVDYSHLPQGWFSHKITLRNFQIS